MIFGDFSGGTAGIRTLDQGIMSPVLMSYFPLFYNDCLTECDFFATLKHGSQAENRKE